MDGTRKYHSARTLRERGYAGLIAALCTVEDSIGGRYDSRPSSLMSLAHRVALRLNRKLGSWLPGIRSGAPSYDRIRQAFRHSESSAAEFTLDLSRGGPSASDPPLVESCLRRHGIVVLRGYIGPALADAARREVDGFVASIDAVMRVPQTHGTVDGVAWQVGYSQLSSYKAISRQHQPLINLRSRERGTTNGGLIDVFGIDKIAVEKQLPALRACCAELQREWLRLIARSLSGFDRVQFDLLRSDSVTSTRGLHVDNLDGIHKAFLYLSDVRDVGDGPYAYVPGSHRRLDLLMREARLNARMGKACSDSLAFEGLEVPILAQKGTVILSCQNGVHRGMPQRSGASRTVLVGSYRP